MENARSNLSAIRTQCHDMIQTLEQQTSRNRLMQLAERRAQSAQHAISHLNRVFDELHRVVEHRQQQLVQELNASITVLFTLVFQ